MAFEDNGDGSVTDSVSTLTWKKAPVARGLWDALVIPSGWRIPTLEELQSLLKDQKADEAGCTAAFGAANLPTDWFWVHVIPMGKAAEWDAGPKTEDLAEKLSAEKPGHVAAYFVWMGFEPMNRRMTEALCRFVQI